LFDIKKGDVVAITGAGGKTSLLNYLSMNLRGRKVISTSTKIYKPDHVNVIINEPFTFKDEDEVIVTANELCKDDISSERLDKERLIKEKLNKERLDKENLYKERLNKENLYKEKLSGINIHAIDSNFDYYIYEADGSKGYPLKGWREDEPIILDHTTKTIGVLDISVLNKRPEDVVFRYEELNRITKLGEVIKAYNLIDIVNHKNGLFKNSVGLKILFINKVESKNQEIEAIKIIEQSHVDVAIIGSIKNKEFKTIKS
jgi:probable selenium-dependent hydroxylase accessory protein YqeC